MPKKLLMGNEAFAWAALIAGVRVVAGYPGTPSSELIETVAKLHADGTAQGVHVEWSDNEKAALEMIAGASYAGARVLFTCKQMGLNVASDALMSLNYIGIKGGMVLFVADDPGPISSQTEQDTRRYAAFAKVPVFDPSTPDEGFAMMQEAFEVSERYHTPVIVRPTTRICHASTFFEVPETTVARPVPEEGFVRDSKWIIFPRRAYQAHGEVNERLPKIAEKFAAGAFNPMKQYGDNPKQGIVCSGVSAAYVREALNMLAADCKAAGAKMPAYRLLQIGTPYPFPQAKALEFAKGLTDITVFEELDYVLEDEFTRLAGRNHLPYTVHGKLDGTTLDRGENTTEDTKKRLGRLLQVDRSPRASDAKASAAPTDSLGRLPEVDRPLRASDAPASAAPTDSQVGSAVPAGPPAATLCAQIPQNQRCSSAAHEGEARAAERGVAKGGPAGTAEPPMRPPVLCAGCPHRGSFYAIKQVLGKKTPAVLCGDIGCYTLGNAKPIEAIDTCLCMGAGITMAQGFAVAEPDKKCIAFVGDSTFFASGMTGVANAVYNQHDITIAVLDNSTTAMTGSQPHPGTGQTLMGPKTDPIDIEAVLAALGVKCITHANPFYLDESMDAARDAIDFDGPSAIIFRAPCIQLTRPEGAAAVDADRCTACRKCITAIGCPAISMREDGKAAHIDPSLCTGCGLCVDVCPFDVIGSPCRAEAKIPFAGQMPAAYGQTGSAERAAAKPKGGR